MLKINFYGGPGVGKSTMAALTFGWLRQQGQSAELVNEWVKNWAYEGYQIGYYDDLFAFANQLHNEDRLIKAGVKILVSDSPLYLQCMYAKLRQKSFTPEMLTIIGQFESQHTLVINFNVQRLVSRSWESVGRFQSSVEGAQLLDDNIEQCLLDWKIVTHNVYPNEIDKVFNIIQMRLPHA